MIKNAIRKWSKLQFENDQNCNSKMIKNAIRKWSKLQYTEYSGMLKSERVRILDTQLWFGTYFCSNTKT